MPRLARLDIPGILLHAMNIWIERRKIFRNNKVREYFLCVEKDDIILTVVY